VSVNCTLSLVVVKAEKIFTAGGCPLNNGSF